ncbi:hypothetical protein OAI93_03310, partial [bacterium]|nr:hypothetical protein [bacterium]
MFKKIFFLSLFTLLMAQDPNWENDLNWDGEFGATIQAAEIYIDGELKMTGKLAAFIDDTISGVDANGAVFFPPTQTYIWEVSLYSDYLPATISFKYWDDVNDVIIDLNETIEFYPNAIWGDAFNPFIFTGTFSDDDGDCVTGDQNWENDFDTDPEFTATLANAIVVIEGEEKTTGKLAAFIGDEVIGVDANGASFFPPSGAYIWEAVLYSNTLSDETVTFKYWDDVNNVVIDLNETLEFQAGSIYGQSALDPFIFTGSFGCDCPGYPEGTEKDCNGDCFGLAFLDSCDVCSGGNSGHVANSDIDCNGD